MNYTRDTYQPEDLNARVDLRRSSYKSPAGGQNLRTRSPVRSQSPEQHYQEQAKPQYGSYEQHREMREQREH